MQDDHDRDLDIPDLDGESGSGFGPGRRPATQTLAALAVDAALTRAARRRIESGRPIAVVVETPSAAWVGPVHRAMRSRPGWTWTHVVAEAAPKPIRRSSSDPSETVASCLAQGGRVLGISPTPERLLPPELVTGADLRLSIGATPEVLTRAIELATGQRPRSVRPELGMGQDFLELASAIRMGTTAGSCLRRLEAASRSLAAVDPALVEVPLLSELHGYGEAMLWAQDLLADLQRWRRHEIPFSALNRAAVLAGEPGTGKTTFVRSLAKTANLPLVATSVGQWFADSPGYLDSVIKQIDAVFTAASARQPAILFIDELDGIPDRRSLSGRGADWWLPVVGYLLTTLDGAVSARASQLIIVGATNLVDRLDPALLRPGRLERVIEIERPDTEALAGILRSHLRADLAGVDLLPLARMAAGATGADAMAWVKGARRRARMAGREMLVEDLVLELAPDDERDPDALRRCAVHEAGHAVAAYRLGVGEIQGISLWRGRGSGGSLHVDQLQSLETREGLERNATVSLAGRAAEIAVFGDASTGAGGSIRSDLAKASTTIASLHASFGFGPTLLYRAPPDRLETVVALDPALQRAVEEDLRRIERRALDLVRENLGVIGAVAERLLEVRYLSGREFAELINAVPEGLDND